MTFPPAPLWFFPARRSGGFLGQRYKIDVRGGEAARFDAVDAKVDDRHQFIDVMQSEGNGLQFARDGH